MSAPPDEACGLTVVRASRRRLAKLIHADGATEGYDSARTVDLHPRPVAGLAGLHALLLELAGRADCCVVRGEPADPARTAGVRRLLHPDAETGDAPTLREVPRRWCALDLDGLPLPAGTDARDLAGCLAAVAPLLPPPFRGAACVVQATAGHAIKPGARLRPWFWLSRPATGAELKAVTRGAPVDVCVFSAAQPIYTAAPVFAGFTPDPLPVRLVLVRGGAEAVDVPAPEALAPPPARPPPPLRLPPADRAGRYALAALARAGAAIRRGDGGRHPLAVREATGLVRLVRAGLVTEREVEGVIAAALDVPGRSPPRDEARHIVAWAMAHADGRGTLPPGVAP